jgi:hypothetical protein
MFFCLLESFTLPIEHTHACTQERHSPDGSFSVVDRSLCSPYSLSPVSLHHFGAAHQASLRSWMTMMSYPDSLAIQGGRVA